jgi:hypothetical protein
MYITPYFITIPAQRPLPAGTLGYTGMGMSRVRVRVQVWTPAGLPVRIPKPEYKNLPTVKPGQLDAAL